MPAGQYKLGQKEYNRRYYQTRKTDFRKKARAWYKKRRGEIVSRKTAWSKRRAVSNAKSHHRWYVKNKARVAAAHRRRSYGLSQQAGEEILSKPCGICSAKSTHIDHDHASNVVRGGLCRSCNHGLGNFKDDPVRLRNAIRYLLKKRS